MVKKKDNLKSNKKNNKKELVFPLKGKYIALVAPSFVVDFSYPKIISQLKYLGFDKAVELTFGAKIVNKEYYSIIQKSKLEKKEELFISSVCPGIVEVIKNNFPEYKKNLLPIDSPMVAISKICKKFYPKHKQVFISPCNFKKIEASKNNLIDYVIDYKELKKLIEESGCKKESCKKEMFFDRFYNDYTKVYPLSGGLSKTLKIRNLLKKEECLEIDGIKEVIEFFKKPDKKIKFLDVTFCKGGCIGGDCINSKSSLLLKKKKILNYLKKADKERIPEDRKGNLNKAEGISFISRYALN